jgi:sodium/bile acid cotransporter 7
VLAGGRFAATLLLHEQAMMSTTPKRFYQDWFLRGMVTAVILASFLPNLGKSGGLLHIDSLSNYGIAAVFFLHGIGIPSEQMKAGLSRWRLHLLVQCFTFVFFPLLWLGFHAAFQHVFPPMLMLGFFYLCALPSTISSSVAMTGLARGNVPAAIFNATLSSLLGIFLTPLLLSLVASTTGQQLSLQHAIVNIATLLLLPFVIGQLLHRPFGKWFVKHKKYTGIFDKAVILLLVYGSFSDSVNAGLWTHYGPLLLIETLAGAALILAMVLVTTTRVARAMQLPVEDEIVAVFCGSKKTLASGVPMAKVLFGTMPGLGLIVLPIMFYHQLQLMVCTTLATRYAARMSDAASAQTQEFLDEVGDP